LTTNDSNKNWSRAACGIRRISVFITSYGFIFVLTVFRLQIQRFHSSLEEQQYLLEYLEIPYPSIVLIAHYIELQVDLDWQWKE